MKAMDLLDSYSEAGFQEVQDLEETVDHYEDKIGTYLVKVSSSELTTKQNEDLYQFLHAAADAAFIQPEGGRQFLHTDAGFPADFDQQEALGFIDPALTAVRPVNAGQMALQLPGIFTKKLYLIHGSILLMAESITYIVAKVNSLFYQLYSVRFSGPVWKNRRQKGTGIRKKPCAQTKKHLKNRENEIKVKQFGTSRSFDIQGADGDPYTLRTSNGAVFCFICRFLKLHFKFLRYHGFGNQGNQWKG